MDPDIISRPRILTEAVAYRADGKHSHAIPLTLMVPAEANTIDPGVKWGHANLMAFVAYHNGYKHCIELFLF